MIATFVTPVFAVDGIITGVETEVKSKGYDTVQGAANIKKTAGTIIRIIRYIHYTISSLLIKDHSLSILDLDLSSSVLFKNSSFANNFGL